MRYAEFLKKGGTIGFVAPSFGCNTEPYKTAFQNALKKFRKMGYQIDLGPNCYAGEGIGISNTPKACGEELTSYYLSGKNDCLISCGGGELMCEILDDVDFSAISQAAPKWFMGFSDNTNMTYLLATLCDTASIYAPCASTYGMEPWHSSLRDTFDLLTGKRLTVHGYPKWEKEPRKNDENPLVPFHVTEDRILKYSDGNIRASGEEIPHVSFQGRLLGGCMDCLVNLMGTRYDRTVQFLEKYREDGILWFLEACDMNVFDLRRAMWHMEHAGWFRYVRGFLIGRPLCFGQQMQGLDAYEAVLEVAERKKVPVLMDVDLGHLPPMMPLMVGSIGKVTVDGNDISIRMQRN